MRKTTKVALLAMGAALTVFYCGKDNPSGAPDVSGIPIEIKWKRFEQALFAIDTNKAGEGLALLEQEYPVFSNIFFQHVVRSKDPQIAPEGHEAYMEGFLKHPGVRKLFHNVDSLFHDMEEQEIILKKSLQYLHYYFPDIEVREITTFLSEYAIGNFIYDDNALAIGLDFYLGADYPYQAINPGNSNFSDYLVRTFNKDHLAVKTLKPIVQEILGPPSGNRLLDLMVHNGKELYILNLLMPEANDSVVLEMKPEQIRWLEDNEQQIWAFLLTKNLIYNSSWSEIRKLVEYSPGSPGMPPQAPGRSANWVGMKIVEAYRQKNPTVSLQDLIAEKDAQKILDDARYKPGRR